MSRPDGTQPWVDVAIPTHAEPLYLSEAIASVLRQTYPYLRLTVFDNTRGGGQAADVVAPYLEDPRVSYVIGGGVPVDESWSRCIQIGGSPYVALLPHDESWDPDYLARRVGFLEAHPKCGYVFSACRVLDGAGRVITETVHPLSYGEHAPEEIIPALYERNPIPTCAILVRRSAYEAVGSRFSARWRMGQDWEMWMRIAVRFPVGYLTVRDNSGRVHEASVSAGSRRWGEMHLRMIDRADELIALHRPGYRLPAGLRERRLGHSYVKAALDALDEEALDTARASMRSAVATDPRVLLRAHAWIAMAGLHGGPTVRRGIGSLRLVEARLQLQRLFAERSRPLERARPGSGAAANRPASRVAEPRRTATPVSTPGHVAGRAG